MTAREDDGHGPAPKVEIHREEGQTWGLVVVKELRHPPEMVWQALVDPIQLREWAPFDADGSLGTVGATVKLTTVGAPNLHVTETTVTRADAPRRLEYTWGGNDMKWELESMGDGTRLTLWTRINRHFIAMGAAGWHVCFDVLDHLLDGAPIGRMAGIQTMKDEGFRRLHAEYARQFGIELPAAFR